MMANKYTKQKIDIKKNTKEKEVCGFEYLGRKCECTDIVGIARCRPLCQTHFNTVRKDNIRRFNKGIGITKAMIFTRKLLYSETWSKLDGILRAKKEVKQNG